MTLDDINILSFQDESKRSFYLTHKAIVVILRLESNPCACSKGGQQEVIA